MISISGLLGPYFLNMGRIVLRYGVSCLKLWGGCLGPNLHSGELSLVQVVPIPGIDPLITLRGNFLIGDPFQVTSFVGRKLHFNLATPKSYKKGRFLVVYRQVLAINKNLQDQLWPVVVVDVEQRWSN